jgi:hypothetical protein
MDADELSKLKQALVDSGYSDDIADRILEWYLTAP